MNKDGSFGKQWEENEFGMYFNSTFYFSKPVIKAGRRLKSNYPAKRWVQYHPGEHGPLENFNKKLGGNK